jgi:prepilin-type N-terminal cleavage/methylation domain-containing protein
MRALGARRRRGTSLVELMIALTLFGIIGLATLRALDQQARFHSGILAVLEARSQHAAAHEAVAVELRSVSSAASDVNRLSDSAIVFRLPVGAGVACAVVAGAIELVPDTVAAGQAFASFRTTPQPGDTAWIFDEGPSDASADDAWIPLHVTAATRATGLCAGSPMIDPALDAMRPSWRLSVSGTPPATLAAGAAVRLTRISRFALYRGGTGEHWLGFSEIAPGTGAWVTIQPVSGPYLPFNPGTPAASGIALTAWDSSGIVTTIPAMTAAITLSTRTRTTRTVRMDGLARGFHQDSLHSVVSLRNGR